MKHFLRHAVLFTAICAVAFPAWAGSPVTLRHNVEIKGPSIRLSDVFDGLPDGLDRDIAIAPAPGKSVTYDLRVLNGLTDQYRLEWQPQSTSEKTVLTRAATLISADMLQSAVLQKIKDKIKNDRTSVEILFDKRDLEIFLPANQAPDFSLINFTYDEPNHRFRTEFVAQAEGHPTVNQTITGRVIVKKSVPVLTRRLAAGTAIGKGDLTWLTLNEDQIGSDVLTDAAQIVGQELRHDQVEDEVLRVHDVIEPRLVTRGALVTLKIQTPLMLITTQGKALQDGTKGDVVRVTNVQSNRIVEGTVEATGVVRVGPFMVTAQAQAR